MGDNFDPTFVTAPPLWKQWKIVADACIHPEQLNVAGYNFQYDEAFGRCCAELWAGAPASMFKDAASKETVRAFILSLVSTSIADPAAYILSFPVTQAFGVPEPAAPSGFHTGVDFGMPSGTPVPAMFAGVVRWAGYDSISGYSVKVQTASGAVWWDAHLSTLAVATGAVVTKGQILGKSGATGMATGPHLHHELDIAGKPVDPMEDMDMATQETLDQIRVVVRQEVGTANADIDLKIDSAINGTMPIMLRRVARWLRLGSPLVGGGAVRDPAGQPQPSGVPTAYADDATPLA